MPDLSVTKQLYKFLASPAEATNMAVDGGTPVEFSLAPAAGEKYTVHRIIISVQDGGAWTADKFGSLTALGNGVLMDVEAGGASVLDLLDGVPITANASWGAFCYDVDLKTWGAGESLLAARWSFDKSGYPLTIDGGQSESLVATIQDDLSDLTAFRIACQGYIS